MLFLITLLFFGISSPEEAVHYTEADVHYTMDYPDGWQGVPVPPEAMSPFEPNEVIYVDEPYIELDSDWNMDVKLFSRYRYTNEFVERWREKYGYTPTLPIMEDAHFFNAIELDHPGLEAVKAAVAVGDYDEAREQYFNYQVTRPRPYHLKYPAISEEAGEAAVIEANAIMADTDFPACRPGMRFTLFGLMYNLERAYLYTNDIKYAEAWLEMFDHWYETYRPPAQRPEMYISFVWMPYWRTLAAGNTGSTLCRTEYWLIDLVDSGLDRDQIFNTYKSTLETANFLYLCNDVFMPSNWQTHQCEVLYTIGTYFPSFKETEVWREQAWELTLEHMDRETYDDGTHCENSVGYAAGVINQYHRTVRLVRQAGIEIPEEFLRRWETMYLWAIKILPPTGSYVPCGDNGIGADGSFLKNIIIKGALEFADPTMKHFAEWYPDDVLQTAENLWSDPEEVLDIYNQVIPEEPSYTSILLPDSGWAVMRESWESDSNYMFFDYGWDEAWHSHPDFGTINIWAYGRPVMTECGRGGAYEADISKRWYKQTIAHNTVMVDSISMRKCVNNRLIQWWTGDGYDFADGLSDGYRWIGVLHNRRVLFVKPEYWIVTDFLPGPSWYGTSFQTSGYHEFDWLAHFQPTELSIDESTKRIDTANDDSNLALIPLNADDVEIVQSVGPLASPDGIVEDAQYISLHQEGMAFKQYQVLLFPYEGTDAPEITITTLEAEETDRASRQNVGYRIDLPGRTDIFLETGDTGGIVTFGDYEFRGDVAHISDAGSSVAGYLLLNSDSLAHNGTMLFSSPGIIEAIEFSISGSALGITSESDLSGITVFAPGVEEVTVNNERRGFSRAGGYIVVD